MNGCITRSPNVFPSPTELREAYDLELQSADNHPVRFGELILEKGKITTIIVFSACYCLVESSPVTCHNTDAYPVRHFLCVYDQEYVRTASSHLTRCVIETIPTTPAPFN